MMTTNEVEFSFSGLKSAFINMVHNETQKGNNIVANDLENLAASFQASVIDVLLAKTKLAMEKYPVKTLIIGGGVSANQGLRERLNAEITEQKLIVPPLRLCGDNAGMIAAAAYIEWQKQKLAGLELNAKPSLVFDEMELEK
jgi:N6-L-threonylcarbamoyladenine synthase